MQTLLYDNMSFPVCPLIFLYACYLQLSRLNNVDSSHHDRVHSNLDIFSI